MEEKAISEDLDLQSMYLSQPVMHAHGIRLTLPKQPPGASWKGMLLLDPNWCSINEWGDRAGCTKMAIRRVHVDVTRLRAYDETGHRRVMYAMHSQDFQQQEDTRLIEFPQACLWYLVQHRKDASPFVVPLFPAELMSTSAGGVIVARYGVALREVIQRGDVSEMRAEAELVRRSLEALEAPPPAPERRADSNKLKEVRDALAELQATLAKLGG